MAGKDEKCVDKALKLIKVEYEVLEAVLDYHTAKDNPILVHPEDNWASLCPGGSRTTNATSAPTMRVVPAISMQCLQPAMYH